MRAAGVGTVAAIVAMVLTPASARAEGALGGQGESCRSRSDCAEGLKCVDNVCGGDGRAHRERGEHEVASSGSGMRTAGKVLFITGISLFGAGWLGTGIATTAIVAGNPASRTAPIGESWVPLVGPYVMLGDSWDYTGGQVAATGVGAAIQTLGFTSMIVGIALWAAAPSANVEHEGRMVVVPWAGRDGAGLAFGGSF